jgi:diguanylate cyclase (GGDEF)-like protein/PAS domain S-box-containing protein
LRFHSFPSSCWRASGLDARHEFPLDLMNQTLRILILEDQVADAELCQEALRRAGLRFTFRRVETRAEFEAAFDEFRPDLIISDFTLPGAFDGLMALELARTRLPDVPFVFVSGTIGEERAVEAVKRGAADYVLKDRMARLGSVVSRALESGRLRKEKDQAEAALKTSETLYRGIFEGATEGILLSTLNGYLLAANPAAAKMLGYGSPEDLESSMTNPGHRLYAKSDARHAFFERVKQEGEVHGYETQGLRKDGTLLWVSLSARLVRDERETTPRVLTMISDISDRKKAEAALNESQSRFQSFMDHLPGRASMRDREGRYLFINNTWQQVFGLSAEVTVGRRPTELFPEGRSGALMSAHARVLESGIAQTRTLRSDGTDGPRWWASLHFPIPDAQGKVVRVGTISMDVTESKLQEDRIARLNRVYAVLSGINAVIVRARDRQDLFDEACRIAVEHGGFGMVWIGLLSREEQEVRAAAQRGFPDDFGEIKVSLKADDALQWNPAARVVAGNEPYFDNNINSQPELNPMRQAAVALGYRSLAILPLTVEGGSVGAMFLYAKETGFFNDEEVKLLTELAGDISFALENISKNEKIARLSRIQAVMSNINALIVRARNPQELFEEACRITVEHGQLGSAWIGSLDPATLDITPVAWAGEGSDEMRTAKSTARDDPPRGQGAVSRAVRERRAIFNNDLANRTFGGPRREAVLELGFRSMIALPLIEGETIVGTFTLYTRETGFFDADEVALLTELAGNVSFALDHIEGQKKIERQSRVRAMSSAINSAIVRLRDRPTLLREACDVAVRFGNFVVAWIGVLDPKTQQEIPVAWAGEDAENMVNVNDSAGADPLRPPGLISRSLKERAPVFDNDLSAARLPAGAPRRREAMRRGYRSVIALPLITDGDVLGNFSLFAREPGFFDDEEVKLLAELAGNISLALERAGAQQKIERLSRIRALSSAINIAIVRAGSRQQLLDEACRIAVEHGGFGIAWIGRFDPATLDVTPVAWAGVGPEQFTRVTTARPDVSEGQGALGQAIRERRPVFINDITAGPQVGGQRRQEAIRRGYRSLIGLPLIVGDAVFGNFTMFAREADFFSNEEVALLSELAGNVSFALESLERQEKVTRLSRIRDVTSEVNAAIVRSRNKQTLYFEACHIAIAHGGFGIAWIGEVDREKLEVNPVASAGMEESNFLMRTVLSIRADGPHGAGVLPRAVRENRPTYNNDITIDPDIGGERRKEAILRGYRSVIVLPLVVEGAVKATFSMFAKELNYFDAEEVSLLTELAGNISLALEHIARQQKLEKLSRIRTVLGAINAAIVRIHGRQELLQEACRIATDAGGFAFVWIGDYDPTAKQVRPTAWAGNAAPHLDTVRAPRPVNESGPGSKGLVAMTVLEKKAVIVNDVRSDPRVSRREMHLDQGTLSIAVLPLVVSDAVSGVLALHAQEAGFFDYEETALLFELSGDIAFALQTIEKQEKLDYLSYYDPLTGLPNRTLFMDRLNQQLHGRGGEQRMVALILLNVERFRYINESLGRRGGDALLKLIGQRLADAFRGKDYLARIGADSFGVVMRGIADPTEILHAVENEVLGCFHSPFSFDGTELRVTAKAGVAMFPADGNDADTLFKNAEAALKKTRESGERYLFYSADMNARAAQVLSLEMRLRKAVEAQEFVLHYQPKYTLADGKISGLEALIRWQDPATGLVPPGTFIPLLEETGLILEVGKWALGSALAQHREWATAGFTAPRIAVNVSPIQLQQRDFADIVINVVQEQGDNPDALELEVTESLLMKDVQASIRKLTMLRGMGITIAMDDFGTGYSSLAYLARLPINSLKIDRSFITGMAGSPQDMGIVTTIITLAHSMNLKVVAEGVETAEQSQLLKLLKCNEAQGYLFSKPLPATDVEPLLRAQAS